MRILLINQKTVLNRGDHAIYHETLAWIAREFPQAELVMSFYDLPSARQAFPQQTIMPSLDSWTPSITRLSLRTLISLGQRGLDLIRILLFVALVRGLGRGYRVFFSTHKQALLDAFVRADLVLSCGGGYLYDDDPQPQHIFCEIVTRNRIIFTLGELLLACLLAKPLILLPQSIGPLRHGLRAMLVQRIVQHARLTFVRERESLALLAAQHCAQRVLYLPDLAFGMVSGDKRQAEALLERAGLSREHYAYCVGVTALDWGQQQRGFTGQQRYEQALITCIDHITAEGGAVVLFAQCVAQGVAWDDRVINQRLRAAAARPQHVYLVNEAPEPTRLQAAYGCMDYFIATRMHAAILAINAGVPVLVINYLHKARGVMHELGLSDACYDIATVTSQVLTERFIALRASPHQPTAQAYVTEAQRAKRLLAALIKVTTTRVAPLTATQR